MLGWADGCIDAGSTNRLYVWWRSRMARKVNI